MVGSADGVGDGQEPGWAAGFADGFAAGFAPGFAVGAAGVVDAAGDGAGLGVAPPVVVAAPVALPVVVAVPASGVAPPTSVAGSGATVATSIGSQRTLASMPAGSFLRSLIVNGTSMWPVLPAAGSFAISGLPSVMPVPVSEGSSGSPSAVAEADPAAPARTSVGARPVFITIDRVNPDDAVSVSIWAM